MQGQQAKLDIAKAVESAVQPLPAPAIALSRQRRAAFNPYTAPRFDSMKERRAWLERELNGTGRSQEEIQSWLEDFDSAAKKVKSSPSLRALQSLLEAIEANVTDTREPSLVIYPLSVTLLICLLAFICGYQDCESIHLFWEEKGPELHAMLPGMPSPRFIPSGSALHRIICIAGEQEQLRELFKRFFASLGAWVNGSTHVPNAYDEEPEDFHNASDLPMDDPTGICKDLMHTFGFDGQEIRGSFRAGVLSRRRKGANLITLFSCTKQIAVDYRNRQTKNQERGAFVEMMGDERNVELIKGNVVMCDAINSTPGVVDAILSAEGQYILDIKGNVPGKLAEAIAAAFSAQGRCTSRKLFFAAHGRVENIMLEFLSIDAIMPFVAAKDAEILKNTPKARLCSAALSGFKQARMVIHLRTDSERLIKSKPKTESDKEAAEREGKRNRPSRRDYYMIASLPYNLPGVKQATKSVGEYWEIESHHSKLDNNGLEQDKIVACNEKYLNARAGFNKIAYNCIMFCIQRENDENPRCRSIAFKKMMTKLQLNVIKAMELLCEFFIKSNGLEQLVKTPPPK